MKPNDTSVLVAMSGGVDSSVALLLLKQQGYTVAGATMKLWDYGDVGGDVHRDGRCCNTASIDDARLVCRSVGAPHYVLDFTDVFKRTVIADFVSEYLSGRTPNPCVVCNTHIKWEMFLRRAREIGCDAIATGHYARTGPDEKNGRHFIRKGRDPNRDQSYALWGISQEPLARTILPLGDLTKTETRRLAAAAGLATAEAPESMEICFVADDDYARFLREWSKQPIPPGDIVNEAGEVLGRHKGIPFYTVGQRRGLGVAHPVPLYVKRIDVAGNRLIVGEDATLDRGEMTVTRVNWVSLPPQEASFVADVKIRYLHQPTPAVVTPLEGNCLHVVFDAPQRAVTPGQSAVLYWNDLVLAGGIID